MLCAVPIFLGFDTKLVKNGTFFVRLHLPVYLYRQSIVSLTIYAINTKIGTDIINRGLTTLKSLKNVIAVLFIFKLDGKNDENIPSFSPKCVGNIFSCIDIDFYAICQIYRLLRMVCKIL